MTLELVNQQKFNIYTHLGDIKKILFQKKIKVIKNLSELKGIIKRWN